MTGLNKTYEPWDQFRENLKIIYWTLVLAIGIIFLLAISLSIGGDRAGPHRIVGLIIIGLEALVWSWVSNKGREMI